ncbi:GNAT family N-acetyltransferase [Nonomuraea sp. K274]|uniref:GNAT family N-acetyltransferase n=1 Tax=Nonomuraea cypriaca TaxID=1187855 RepID=A0A931AFP4_9ACTN|nr:GNAT family N-acetyltransferase [Nonomuraea cypriaca]MBF8189678.1 GNAT family N-acetyltransferase [Nonomuraea cypriaca]
MAFFHGCRADAYAPLAAAMAGHFGRPLRVVVDEGDDLSPLTDAGFVLERRESRYTVSTGPASVPAPSGFTLVTADLVPELELRELDDELRQDVPGAEGWNWDERGFRKETYESSQYDPATYLVAVNGSTGLYTGIARIWIRPSGPRLGMVAVTRAHRRRGLARAMLSQVFGVLHGRGLTEVSTEIDDTNLASIALLADFGARRTGADLWLVRR